MWIGMAVIRLTRWALQVQMQLLIQIIYLIYLQGQTYFSTASVAGGQADCTMQES
jgi:hypothetical protein